MAKHAQGTVFTSCPQCGHDIYDNRAKIEDGTYKARSPHFACTDKDGCKWASWPDPTNQEPQGGRMIVDAPRPVPDIVEQFTPSPHTPNDVKVWYEGAREIALALWGRQWMNDNPQAFQACVATCGIKADKMGVTFTSLEEPPAVLAAATNDDLPF